MAKEEMKVIKEADLTNNCPECFNQELALQFFQKHRYSKFYHQVTGEVSHKLTCKTCGSQIFPVSWTADIERSFGYFQKMVEPEKKATHFTLLFYVLILLLVAVVGAAIYMVLETGFTS